MSIQEINLHELREIYSPEAQYFICTKPPSNFVWFENYFMCPILTPSNEEEYKAGLLEKDEFEAKYKRQLNDPIVKEFVSRLKSIDIPIYLVTGTDTGFLIENIDC